MIDIATNGELHCHVTSLILFTHIFISEIEMEQDDSLTSSPRPMRKPIAIKLKSNKSPSTGRRKTKGSRSSKKDENNGTGQTGTV